VAIGLLVDSLRDYLQGALSPAPALLGGAFPAAPGELPAVCLSVSAVTEHLRGLGRVPRPTLTGALRLDETLDLARPVVTFPDDEVTLLSGDRKTLHLAHGPLVKADGTITAPWAAGDLRVTLGATVFEVANADPAAGQVRPLPDAGNLVFGEALPGTGTLTLSYFVGEWEVRSVRYQGVLGVDVLAADSAGVEALTRQVETALLAAPDKVAGVASTAPVAWGAIGVPDETRGNARGRTLAYSFDYELVQPSVGTGGGLISTITVVRPDFPDHTEDFEIHEGS